MKTKWFVIKTIFWVLLAIVVILCLFTTKAPATTEVAVPAAGSTMINERVAAIEAEIAAKQASLTFITPLSKSDVNVSIADAVADGATKGSAAFNANDFNAASGVITLDYWNGLAADASHKGYLTPANWTTFNGKENVLTFTYPLIRESDAVRLHYLQTFEVNEANNLYYTDVRARASISESVAGLDYNNTTGVFTLTSDYTIPADACIANWNTARLNTQNVTLADGNGIIFGKSTGGQIGTEPNQLFAFYGATPVDQPNALTVALTTITYVEPNTANYAVQAFTQNSGWGFADPNQAQTTMKVINNLQIKVQELENRLEELGLVKSN
jgi:hypothetical protein